jgi:hypothetical protein
MSAPAWRERFQELLPLYGHRNWILIADAAFPAQVGSAEIVATGEDHVRLVETVLDALRSAPHVRPVIRLDAELDHLPEPAVPGLKGTRGALHRAVAGLECTSVPHAELLERLAEVGRTYRVLVLKSTGTVPYSSVFVELDCGYWTPEQEAMLGRSMGTEVPRD